MIQNYKKLASQPFRDTRKKSKPLMLVTASFIFSLFAINTTSFAQDQGFAEDFSDASVVDYSFFTFGEGDNIPPQIDESGIPRLTGTSIRDSQGVEIREHFNSLELNTNGNLVETRVVLTRDTNDLNTFARARIRIQSFADREGPEDVQVLMEYTVGEDTQVRLRARRVIDATPQADIEDFFVLEDGTTSSRLILPVDATPGIEHLMRMTIDTNTRTISYAFDNTTGSVVFNAASILPSSTARRSIDNFTFVFPDDEELAVNARSTLRINSVRTDEFEQDFGVNTAVDLFNIRDVQQPGSTISSNDGRVRLSREQQSAATNRTRTRLRFSEPAIVVTDYLEATLNLSSESQLSSGQFNLRMSGTFYNDQPGGVSDGEQGDVYIGLAIGTNSDGERFAFFITSRSNDPFFSSSVDVIDLIDSSFIPEFDTDYIGSIELDRERAAIIVTLENEDTGETAQREIEVTTPISNPSGGFRNVQVRVEPDTIGEIIGFVDNIRTDPNALTAGEIAAIATVPGSPSPVDPTIEPMIVGTCIDPDGDGFGWNGFATCDPTIPENIIDPPPCIDTDGDGYGWDGTQSCRVDGFAPPQAPIFQPAPSAGVCIDTDGDGFGFDGTQSCLVDDPDNSLTPLCIDTDGDGFGWDGQMTCIP